MEETWHLDDGGVCSSWTMWALINASPSFGKFKPMGHVDYIASVFQGIVLRNYL
jgi:hypothetical protein